MPSTSGTLADAFVTAIQGLALSGSPQVGKRKRLVLLAADPDDCVWVAQGDGEELEPLADFGAGLQFLVVYPVSVGFVSRNKGRLRENETLRANRQAVRDRFHLPGDIAGVNDIHPGGDPVFDMAGLDKGLDWSVLTFRVEVIE